MGRIYAGVLGPLAFFTEIARALVRSGGIEATVMHAAIGLFVFAAIGYVVGELAGWTVDQSVRAQLAAEIAATNEANKVPAIAGAIRKK